MLTVRSKAMALGTTLLAGMTQFRQAHLAKKNKPYIVDHLLPAQLGQLAGIFIFISLSLTSLQICQLYPLLSAHLSILFFCA